MSALHKGLKLVCGQFGQSNMQKTFNFCPRPARKNLNVPQLKSSLELQKVEKIQEDSLDWMPSPLRSVKIQMIGGKVYLR